MRDYLVWKIPALTPERIDEMLDEGRFVDSDGQALTRTSWYQPNCLVFFHRDLPDESPPPGTLDVIYQDDNIVVLDKPHFTASIPRGQHVVYSAVVRARRELGLPELGPAHRLDRLTSGLLLCTVRREVRGAYQTMFERRRVKKTYHAVAPVNPDLTFPIDVTSHIVKEHGRLTVTQRFDLEPNAHTTVELIATSGQRGLYRVTPHTGRTHQIRVHMLWLGIPILHDPLYPVVTDQSLHDFSAPLQLCAKTLEFSDPITGVHHRFQSRKQLCEFE